MNFTLMEFILKEINKIQRLMLQILAIMTLIIAKHQKADINSRPYRYTHILEYADFKKNFFNDSFVTLKKMLKET